MTVDNFSNFKVQFQKLFAKSTYFHPAQFQLSIVMQTRSKVKTSGIVPAIAGGSNKSNKKKNKTGAAKKFAEKGAKMTGNIDEEDTSLDSSNYDVLFSAAGATEKQIAAYGNYSQTFVVPANSAFVYKARVKKLDIGFSVREIRENDGIPVVIEPLLLHSSEAQIQSKIPPSERQRIINQHFDNSHSSHFNEEYNVERVSLTTEGTYKTFFYISSLRSYRALRRSFVRFESLFCL